MAPRRRSSFNPRPRTGGDIDTAIRVERIREVSIRALARGATVNFHFLEDVWRVSIRAPARGATFKQSHPDYDPKFQSAPPHGERPPPMSTLKQYVQFQSAPPHGERRDAVTNYTLRELVSIRAPAFSVRGAAHGPVRNAPLATGC